MIKMKLISFTYIGDGIGLMLCLFGYLYQDSWKVFMILASVIGGYFNAGFGGLVMAVLVELVDPEYFSIAVGMQSIFIGIGESLGPLIGGACNDAFAENGYLVAVLAGGCLMVASGVVAAVMHFVYQKEMRIKKEKLEREAQA
jgi:MFS family permease